MPMGYHVERRGRVFWCPFQGSQQVGRSVEDYLAEFLGTLTDPGWHLQSQFNNDTLYILAIHEDLVEDTPEQKEKE